MVGLDERWDTLADFIVCFVKFFLTGACKDGMKLTDTVTFWEDSEVAYLPSYVLELLIVRVEGKEVRRGWGSECVLTPDSAGHLRGTQKCGRTGRRAERVLCTELGVAFVRASILLIHHILPSFAFGSTKCSCFQCSESQPPGIAFGADVIRHRCSGVGWFVCFWFRWEGQVLNFQKTVVNSTSL